jgi:hypothetical protein
MQVNSNSTNLLQGNGSQKSQATSKNLSTGNKAEVSKANDVVKDSDQSTVKRADSLRITGEDTGPAGIYPVHTYRLLVPSPQ